MVENRICTICKENKDIYNFPKRTNRESRFWQCKKCRSKISTSWDKKNWIRKLISYAKTRAIKNNIEFNLTKEWILVNINKICPCCKKEMNLDEPNGRGKHVENRPSLDKINSKTGYTEINTRVICTKCNIIKNYGNINDHYNILQWLYSGAPQKNELCENGYGI